MRAWMVLGLAASLAGQTVTVQVDASRSQGPLPPVYAFFGYDEPNYTYMKDGRKLLPELASLSPVPVYVRTHNLLTTGDGTPGLKWGSTNAYTEDANGNPRYDWTLTDRIFDAYVERGMKPLVEIGFMPEALSVKPQPYRHSWGVGNNYGEIFTGWAYPPKDYTKWAELVYQWVRHCLDKYGRQEVESWLWEVWNEPNIGYWKGTQEEYHKLYDYAAEALKRALPTARIGGPHSTGPNDEKAARFLRDFLEHVTRGKNYVTGKTGSPIDYVGFHAKGRPQVVGGTVQMGISKQLNDISRGFEIAASFPALKQLPIIIGESDPEGCAACSSRVYPQNNYRNGTLYASYTAASFARKHDLAALHGVNLLGAVTWAFEFEDQPYFDGFRDLATNGIAKPVLNVFRMMGLMGRERVEASSTGAIGLDAIRRAGVREAPDVGVLASRDSSMVTILLWNYHDVYVPAPPTGATLSIQGLPAARVRLEQFRVDEAHSNSYEAWKRMGSPQEPTPEQYERLERAGRLEMADSPVWKTVQPGKLVLSVSLPRQSVALIRASGW